MTTNPKPTDAMIEAGEQKHWELAGSWPSRITLAEIYTAMEAARTPAIEALTATAHATNPTVGGEPRFTDNFFGDDAKLLECADALLALDARGTLYPHGIGGHARNIIGALASRLQARAAITKATGGSQ